jgi:hypothetical protein
MFLAFGITANVLLYVSFSDSLLYQIIYGAIGAGLDLWKAGALLLALALWIFGRFIMGFLAFAFFIALTGISIAAGFGFTQQMLSEYEEKARVESDSYKALQARVEAAQSRVDSMSQYASLGADATSTVDALQAEKTALLQSEATNMAGVSAGTVAQRVGDCSGSGYYIGKYCPAIRAIDAKIADARRTASNANSYSGAVQELSAAQAALAGASSGGAQHETHPMFIGLGALLGISAVDAKYRFFIMSIIIAELLGTLSLFMANRISHAADFRNMTVHELVNTQKNLQNSMDELRQLSLQSVPGGDSENFTQPRRGTT